MVQSYLPGGANVPTGDGTLSPPGEYDWTCASFSTPESTAQTANRSVQPFLHHSRQKVPILYNGGPSPKLPLLVGESGPPSISWFLETDRAHNPNCITVGSAIFAQVTTECPYTLQWAPLSPIIAPSHGVSGPQGTIPETHPSPQTKRHLYRYSHFCTHDCRVSLYFTMGRPFPPQNCPFPWEDLDPHLIHGSLGPPKSSTQMASRLVQPF